MKIKEIKRKRQNILIIILIIMAGLLTRTFKFKNILWDKYLGDLLYAVMFYYIFKLFVRDLNTRIKLTFLLMIFFELIQLTGFTAFLKTTDFFILHILAFLIGSQFSFIDIGVYIIGLSLVYVIEKALAKLKRDPQDEEEKIFFEISKYAGFFRNMDLLLEDSKNYHLLLENPSKELQKKLMKYKIDSIPNIKFGTFFPKSCKFMVEIKTEVQEILVKYSNVNVAPDICSHLFILHQKSVIADWYDFPFDSFCVYKSKVTPQAFKKFGVCQVLCVNGIL